jgi:hypothetical protein
VRQYVIKRAMGAAIAVALVVLVLVVFGPVETWAFLVLALAALAVGNMAAEAVDRRSGRPRGRVRPGRPRRS